MSSPGSICFSSSQQRMPRVWSPAPRDEIRKPSVSTVGKRNSRSRVPSGTAQSTENESGIVSNLRFLQHRYEFLLKAALLAMKRLLGDVFHHRPFVRCANAKRSVSLLPCEMRPVLVQPS